MTTILPKEPIVAGLAEEWSAIDELLAGLPADAWATPSPCPGWDVHANVAHIIGTESMLAGIEAPDVGDDVTALPHVRNDIGAFNERWIVGLAGTPPDEMLDRFRKLTAERLDALRAMDDDAWNAEGFTPAGTDTHGRFMRIRIFDCWMHEQDIRTAVGRPGHESGAAVDLALDEMVGALGFVVGKRAGAPDGTTVTFDLTGPAARRAHVAVDGRAALVEELPGPPTVTLRMPVLAFSRRAGGRDDGPSTGPVEVDGDAELANRILDALAYTI